MFLPPRPQLMVCRVCAWRLICPMILPSNAPLAPFALATMDLLGLDSPEHTLDVVSVVESTLDDPRPLLYAQQRAARGEAVAAMKAEGLDYDERMEALEAITWPQPLAELLAGAYGFTPRPTLGLGSMSWPLSQWCVKWLRRP